MTQLTKEQARAAVAAMLPRLKALEDLMENPMLQLPDQVVDWAAALDQRRLHHATLCALHNIVNGGDQ